MAAEPLPAHQRRKFSFPAALHSNLLLGSDGQGARRRFSNVSDAVSRKLSHTMGWRSTSVPTPELVEQARALCAQYIRSRLKRAGLFSRKCGLQRMRAATPPAGYVVREVFPELSGVGQELERMHPKLYSGVARQASGTPGGILAGDKAPGCVLSAVARELFKTDVTWGKVVALFAVAGGLAVDCVRQGHPDYLHSLPEAMAELVEDELAPWIVSNGGWGLLCHYKPPNNEVPMVKYVGVLAAIVVIVLLLVLSLRLFGKLAFI